MQVTVTGTLVHKYDEEVISETFKKRDFAVKIDEDTQYPQEILLQLIKDKCDIIDNYALGTKVIVSFNLQGRKWVNKEGEPKFFNTLQAYTIKPVTM